MAPHKRTPELTSNFPLSNAILTFQKCNLNKTRQANIEIYYKNTCTVMHPIFKS